MITQLTKILLLFFCLVTLLQSNNIDLHTYDGDDVSLLENSDVFISDKNISLAEIVQNGLFEPYKNQYINISNEKKVVWIQIKLSNTSSKPLNKILLFSSSFLEHIYLYKQKYNTSPKTRGQAHFDYKQTTLLPYFPIHVAPLSTQIYYLKVYSVYTPVLFKLTLTDENDYLQNDKVEQAVNIFLIGFIFALMIYSLVISLYLKDISYIFYSLYLFVLLYDQMRYLGLTQVYFSSTFMQFDLDLTITRIFLLPLTSSLFVLHFLKLKHYPKLNKLYLFIVYLCIVLIIFFYNSIDYGISIVMVLSFIVIILHFFVGIYAYKNGQKQARLYLIGFGIVFFFYLLIISDSMGFTSLLQEHHNALLIATTFEALVLSLAFADRYNILQKEKKRVVTQYLTESQNRETLIESEVHTKTQQLQEAIEAKELLLQEVHHRVKNNLHIILSMIQMQHHHDDSTVTNTMLHDLENRINAIAKTYEMLILNGDIQHIHMQPYIEQLLGDIQESFSHLNYIVNFNTKIKATLPLREAVYIGIIINEAITNSYKYAFKKNQGDIHLSLIQKQQSYTMQIEDSGEGFTQNAKTTSMGIKLIQTLAEDQLHGSFTIHSKGHTQYKISFIL